MELMGKTAANENTASMWVEQLPRFVAGSKPEEQHQIFRDLGALLADRTPETIKDIDAGLLRLEFNHLAKSSAVMGQLQDTALPDLWSSMVEDFKNGLLSKQAWFSAVAGQDAKTLPEPSERADRLFFEKCASHQVPSLEVLSQIAPLVDDSEKTSEMVNQHKADNLMLKTASVLHQILLLTGEVPIPAAVPQLEAIAKEIAELMEMEQAMGLEGAAKESVRKFFTAHITTKFFAAADCVVSCVQNMQKAIPDQYEKLVEQRNVAQLKAALFSKRTHEAVTSNQDLAVAGTEAMRSVVKSSGHVTSGGCLGRFRTHDSALKAVRCYTTTVHGLNILLHKLPPPGKQNRERAAMIREHLGNYMKLQFGGFVLPCLISLAPIFSRHVAFFIPLPVHSGTRKHGKRRRFLQQSPSCLG